MSLGDVIAQTLPQLRAAAESLMRDSCRARRVTGTATVEGTVTPTYATVYEGKCRIQSRRPWPSNPEAGEHSWTLVPFELHLPVSAPALAPDDLVEITTSVDDANVGRTLRVKSGDRKTFGTALRYLVEEIAG